MATFWTMTGFIPLILYGIALYLLFWRLPRWIRSRSARAPKEPVTVPIQTRKRSSGSISQVAEPAAQISAVALASAASRPSAQEAHQAAVSETVSVVLRRQIPPRFDQPSRSWIGGLPQMPDEMEWPRSISSESPQQGERPLHFLAQVCCADLPRELWGGLGPRDGWLLLFIDPNQGCPEGPDAFKVLHIDALGPEREPPFDLGPVYDGVYTGPDYRYLLPDEPVPNTWRRWPVDLIVVPNEAREEQGRTLVTPENFAPILYDGAEVRSGHSLPAPPRPLTVGHARYALAAVRRNLDRAVPPIKISEQFTDELKKSGAIAALLRNCAAEQAAIRGKLGEFDNRPAPESEEEQIERANNRRWFVERIAYFDRLAAWLRRMQIAEAIVAYLEESPELESAWQDKVRAHVDQVFAALRAKDPNRPLSEADWAELVATFEGYEFTRWQNDRMHEVDGEARISFREYNRSGALRPPDAMHQLIKDLYLSPDQHGVLPRDIVAQYEPHWRDLYSNRPHRMGGYHDGVQSDAVIGPAKDLLLFQIASDDAMQWVWGDAGAYYFWIRPKHLEAKDFSGVQMRLECH